MGNAVQNHTGSSCPVPGKQHMGNAGQNHTGGSPSSSCCSNLGTPVYCPVFLIIFGGCVSLKHLGGWVH